MSQFEKISNILSSTSLASINELITVAQFWTHVNNAFKVWYTFLIKLQTWFNDIITQYINWVSVCQQEHEQTQIELKQSQINNEILSEIIQELKSMSRIDIKSEKYSNSELYIKERENKLNQFIFELISKLKLNVNHYSTFEFRLLYEYSRLSKNTVAQALSHMTAQHDKLVMIEQLVVLLRQVFNDSDKQEIAQRFISVLRMQNRIFIEYLFDFQQHIDAIEYEVVTQKFNLKNELFSELKALLIQMNVSSLNYEQLIIKCQQLNSRYRVTVQNLLKSKAVIHSVSVISTVLAYLFKYATFLTDLKATISSSRNLMNLSIVNMKKWDSLTFKKHQHRMISHLCLYCDKSEHQTAICNSKLKIQLRIISLFTFAISIDNLTFNTSFVLKKV
jgi:hypothetical protein